MKLFHPLAQGGHPEASRFVEALMKLTRKERPDIKAARQWLSVAAQKGDQASTKNAQGIQVIVLKFLQ